MKFVLLTGYAGSGKDTVGSVFQKYGYKRYAVADMLKYYSAEKHGFEFILTQTQEGKSSLFNNKTVRQYLIDDAAILKKEHNDPSYWIKPLVELIITDGVQNIVITDWRYNAEITHIYESFPHAEIVTVRIVRGSIIPLLDDSEHELDNYTVDFTIQNNGSLDYLNKAVITILNNAAIQKIETHV